MVVCPIVRYACLACLLAPPWVDTVAPPPPCRLNESQRARLHSTFLFFAPYFSSDTSHPSFSNCVFKE